jgi:hypothetical protein
VSTTTLPSDTDERTWQHYRAKVSGLSRDRAPDDPELVEARRSLRAVRLRDHVAKALAAAPPLSEQQRTSIARLLTGGDAS